MLCAIIYPDYIFNFFQKIFTLFQKGSEGETKGEKGSGIEILHVLVHSPTGFPGTLTGSWLRSGAAGARTSAHTGCKCQRQRILHWPLGGIFMSPSRLK